MWRREGGEATTFFINQINPPSLPPFCSRIASLYFLFDVFNVFLGTVLGGSLTNSFRVVLKDPAKLPRAIGSAMPTTSSAQPSATARHGANRTAKICATADAAKTEPVMNPASA